MTIMWCMAYTASHLQDCAPQVWYCELWPRCQVLSKIQYFLSAWEGGCVNNLTALTTMHICIVCTFNQCLQQQHNVDGQCRKQVVVFRATLKRIIRAIKRYCYCSQHGLPKSRVNPLH